MSLLLLPALTLPVKRSSWSAVYRSTIEHVLKRLQPSNDTEIARLDIAVVMHSSFQSATGRTTFFPDFQDILREVYSLVCVSAVAVKVDLDFPGGVDARVIFLDSRATDNAADLAGKQCFSGPIVDLHTFAAARRPYQTIFSVESEASEVALSSLLQLWHDRESVPAIERTSCSSSIAISGHQSTTTAPDESSKSHKNVAVGGTFDHLHIGHKLLLSATIYMAEPDLQGHPPQKRALTIGITGDELLVNKKHGALVESWEERQQRTAELIDSLLVFHPNISSERTVQETDLPGPNGKVVKVTYGKEVEINYTRISDPFGPTITDEAISALIVSAETRSGGKAVNEKRTEKGWEALDVFEIDVLDAGVQEDDKSAASNGQTFESKISSTEIRRRLEVKQRSSNGHL